MFCMRVSSSVHVGIWFHSRALGDEFARGQATNSKLCRFNLVQRFDTATRFKMPHLFSMLRCSAALILPRPQEMGKWNARSSRAVMIPLMSRDWELGMKAIKAGIARSSVEARKRR